MSEEEKKEVLKEEVDLEQLDEVTGGGDSGGDPDDNTASDSGKGVLFSCGKNYYCLIPWHHK